MCTDFYEAMQLEKGTVQRTAQAVAEKMEKDRLYRELNAHTISLNFNPPTISQRVSRIEVGSAYSCAVQCNNYVMNIIQFLGYSLYIVTW